MQTRSWTERCAGVLALVSIAFVVAGTKACQEDYEVGSQAATKGTPSATPTDDGSGDGVATQTPTPNGTQNPAATAEPTAEPEPTTTPAAATSGDVAGLPSSDTTDPNNVPLLQALSDLSEKPPADAAVGAAKGKSADSNNWLGKAFKGGSEGGAGAAVGGASKIWHDSDGDGFADWLETEQGTDVYDSMSTPDSIVTTSLDGRLRASDSDLDGISNVEEQRLGTNPKSLDSDNDGRPDGAEVLSNGDPTRPDDRYKDSDGDGLSDEFETSKGTKPDQLDSDDDGLRDDVEFALGTDPLQADTDKDGISDGKEFDLGSDPTVSESGAAK